MTQTWTITVEEDSEGCFLSLPDDLLKSQGWQEGDTINWIDDKNGAWILRKSDDSETKTD